MTAKPIPGGPRLWRLLIFPTLLFFSAMPMMADDVLEAQMYKGQNYVQGTNGLPARSAIAPYEFEAIAGPIYAPWVSDVSIQTPALATDLMTLDQDTNFSFTASAASQAALDSAYGEGTYTIQYTGLNDGPTTIQLALGADDFPPVPAVSNIMAAQSVIASNAFTLTFAAEADAGTNDYVQLMIRDAETNLVFRTTPIYYLEGLNASNTAIPIPARTLAPGETYTGVLQFLRLTTLPVLNLPFTQAGFFTETIFPLQTQSTNGGGSTTNNPPPPPSGPLAPAVFTGGFLTLTVTNGSGSFAASGVYQLFTSSLGTNYFILGPSGQGLTSGTYTYAVTGSNSATLTLTDAMLGGLSLEILFTGQGEGSYSLVSAADGSQSGTFTATTAYASVTPANFYLPSAGNGAFQSYFSGQQGATYALEKSDDLAAWSTLSSFSLQDLSTNVTDSTGVRGQFYRARLSALAFAPATVQGQTFNLTISSGAAPLASNGAVQWQAGASGNSYQILSLTGATNGSGAYTYILTGPSSAVITYTDSTTATASSERLVFTSLTTGYFYTANTANAGYQSGSFSMAAGPSLFYGNARFSVDEARSASGVFPANGTPFSLSVTDAVGYVWTLSVPADGLLTSVTLSMKPFTGIDSSQLALPVVSGVQLGPEGTEFCDGVTLSLTAPAPLGAHATLMMGKGDGSNLLLVQTTNQANVYSTTLFHFSSGMGTDPSDQQWQDYLDQHLPQAQAAYAQAQSQVQALERPVVVPPEPPDYEFNCSGDNPAGDAQVDAYIQALFANETTAIQNLLSAARDLVLLTGDDSYGDNAITLAEQLVSTSCFRKINSLFSAWSGSPLKFTAVAKAALYIARQDQLLGGPGLPNVFDQLQSWLSGNVINYYWDKLKSQHDYSMAQVLLQIERQIQLLGGPANDSITQKIAGAYTFQATVNITLTGNTGYGGGAFNLTAQGTINITGDPNQIFPLSGTNNVNYTAGTFYNAVGDQFTLQLPLSYPQRIFMTIDNCTNLNASFYMSDPEHDLQDLNIIEETWNLPKPPPPTEQLSDLGDGFDDAFGNDYSTPDDDYDCQYVFPLPLQNQQAQAANVTFSGPDSYFGGGVTVALTITLQHTPQ